MSRLRWYDIAFFAVLAIVLNVCTDLNMENANCAWIGAALRGAVLVGRGLLGAAPKAVATVVKNPAARTAIVAGAGAGAGQWIAGGLTGGGGAENKAGGFGSVPVVTGGGGGPVNKNGMPMFAGPTQVTYLKAPRGYVMVTNPLNGDRAAMLRGPAISMGLFKARRKPPISASDWRMLSKAEATAKKAERVLKAAGKATGKKLVSRTAGRRTMKNPC